MQSNGWHLWKLTIAMIGQASILRKECIIVIFFLRILWLWISLRCLNGITDDSDYFDQLWIVWECPFTVFAQYIFVLFMSELKTGFTWHPNLIAQSEYSQNCSPELYCLTIHTQEKHQRHFSLVVISNCQNCNCISTVL